MKKGLLSVKGVVGITILILAALLAWQGFTFFLETYAPYPYEHPLDYKYENSKWVCQETGTIIVLDRNMYFLCKTPGDPEWMKLIPPFARGRTESVVFWVVATGTEDVTEIDLQSYVDGSTVLESRFLRCDEQGFMFRIKKKYLPIWGLTEPATLYFVREELPYEADFTDPENPVFAEFDF